MDTLLFFGDYIIITFVVPTLSKNGGISVILKYSDLLEKKGHRVNIIVPLVPPFIYYHINKYIFLNFKKYLNKISKNKDNINYIKIPFFNKLFVNMIPKSDAIIATSWETAYFVEKIPNYKGKKYYFVQNYEIWKVWNNERYWHNIKDPVEIANIKINDRKLSKYKMLIDNTYLMNFNIITISSWLKYLINDKFNKKVLCVIPNGVDFNNFYCNFKNWDNKITLLMPYREIPWKGDQDGLKAFNIIYNKYGNTINYVLYGIQKPYNLPHWIKFYEKPSDEKLRQLYCDAHIFVLPSWVEGCQLPPMEAMACKCAVVATNVGGVPDYAIHKKTALVVPPRKSFRLAEAISYCIENKNHAKKMAENGHAHIKNFTWFKSVNMLENILLSQR